MRNGSVSKGGLRPAFVTVITRLVTGLDILGWVVITGLVLSLGKIVGDDGMPIFDPLFRGVAFVALLFMLWLKVDQVRDWWFYKRIAKWDREHEAELKELDEAIERLCPDKFPLRSERVRGPVAQSRSHERTSGGSGADRAMNNKELQATRKLLMLDVSEAAELIGGVSPRTWQYWEAGRNAVPTEVADEMRNLLSIRLEMMDEIDQRLERGEERSVVLPFYSSFEQYVQAHPGRTKVAWRLSQAVAAHHYTEGHAALR